MPYEGEVAAFWAVIEDGEPRFRKTSFDVERAIAAVGSSQWPQASDFVAENLQVAASGRKPSRAWRTTIGEQLVEVGRVGKPHGLAGASSSSSRAAIRNGSRWGHS